MQVKKGVTCLASYSTLSGQSIDQGQEVALISILDYIALFASQ